MQVYSYVLAFEVLDNLPHDCVVQHEDQEEWMEVTVEQEAHGSLRLSERQLQDELIKTVLTSAHWGKTGMITNSKSLVHVHYPREHVPLQPPVCLLD